MRVLITGGSRGIGRAIACRFAKERGAHVAILGRSKSRPSHPTLLGTLNETASEIEALGGTAHPFEADLRDATHFQDTLRDAVCALGGEVDVLVNNASVLSLERESTPKTMNLLYEVNTRGCLLAIQTCRDALSRARGSIVTLAPPIRLGRLEWISQTPAYTISKYSMTLATLQAADEHVRANTLWPARMVATAATRRLEAVVPGAFVKGRPPSHTAEAVFRVATDRSCTARSLLDDEVISPDDPRLHEAPLDAFVDERFTSDKILC